jgi:hypothetical protein
VLLSSLVVCFFSVPYILYAESPTVTLPSTTSLTTGAAETAAREKIDAEKARATLLSDITKLGNSPTVSQIEAFCKNQKGTADANNLGWNNGSLYTSCINWADTERNRFNVEGPSACKSGSGDPSTGIFTCDEKYSAADIATARAAVTAAKNSFINEAQKVSVPAQKVQSAQLAYDSCIAENPTNPSTACADQKKALDSAKVASEVAASAANEARDETECSFTNLGSWFSYCIRDGAQWLIKVVLVGLIAAPVLGASGAFFDLVLRISIVNFSDMLGLVDATSSTDSTIYATWVIVRNLFNIIILFQLLKIAIEKIIGRSLGKDKGDLKQKLVAIIIFSLLTNFSFFFTKAMIDLSNIVALQFYAGLGASPTDATGSILKGSISIAIVDSLGIGTAKILQTTGAIERGSATGVLTDATTPLIDIGGGKTGTIYDTFTGSIVVFCLLMLAAFILVQGAMIFLSRAVVLVFLIVLSPLMFAGGIMGFVDKWSKEWWKKLTEQLFVAPLYLAMLFVTLKVAGNGTEAGLLKSLQ